MDSLNILFESLQNEWHALVRVSPRIVLALIVFTIFLLFGRFLSRNFVKVLSDKAATALHTGFFRNLIAWTFGIIGGLVALNILGLQRLATSLLAGGGIAAVALGFAFREIGENLLAGFFLAFSRPFKVGDVIASGEFVGTVVAMEMRYTHIRSDDGRDIFIPSSQIFNRPLVNYTRDGLRRFTVAVGIDYRDDAGSACSKLLDVVTNVVGVIEDPAPGVAVTAFTPQYVELSVFFWVNTFDPDTSIGRIRTDVMDGCRRALLDNGFTVSAECVSNIDIGGRRPLEVELQSGERP